MRIFLENNAIPCGKFYDTGNVQDLILIKSYIDVAGLQLRPSPLIAINAQSAATVW